MWGLVQALAVAMHNLDVFGASLGPPEADAVLAIDANAVLTGAISLQGLEMIPRWKSQVIQSYGIIHTIQLVACNPRELHGAYSTGGSALLAVIDVLGASVAKRADHMAGSKACG